MTDRSDGVAATFTKRQSPSGGDIDDFLDQTKETPHG
jgi:hypothetical protein